MKIIFLCVILLFLSRFAASLRFPLKALFCEASKQNFELDGGILINSRIAEIDADLKQLKENLPLASGDERLVYLQQILVKEQQLASWIERLPKPGKNRSNQQTH